MASVAAMGQKHWRYVCGGGIITGVAGVVWYRQTRAMLYSGLPTFLEKEACLATAAAAKAAEQQRAAAAAEAAQSESWVPSWLWSTGAAETPQGSTSPSTAAAATKNVAPAGKYLSSTTGALTLTQAEELPGLDGYAHVTTFMDRAAGGGQRGDASNWELETDTFSNPAKLGDPNQIRVFRNREKYCLDKEDVRQLSEKENGGSSSGLGSTTAGKVPFLRIMGYLPDVTTETMMRYLVLDPKLRLEWDPNQSSNDHLANSWEHCNVHPEGHVDVSSSYTAQTTPLKEQKRIRSQGLFAKLIDHVDRLDMSSMQITYTLSSKVFERLGVRSRQVWTEMHRFVPRNFTQQDLFGNDNLPQMLLSRSIPIRFLGDTEEGSNPPTPTETIAKVARDKLSASSLELLQKRSAKQPHEVFQHFQQIVLIPVEDSAQIHGVLQDHGTAGVMRSLPTIKELRDYTSKSNSEGSLSKVNGPFEGKGVVMVLTSVNDGKMASMPRWIERQLGRYFGGLAQSSLLVGIEKKKDRMSDTRLDEKANTG